VKVFDNVYFLGQTEFTVWAINTSDGIILTDAIFEYSVEAEVTDGLKKMGLDPKRIKYAIISHAHGDHDGGAKYLQDTYGARLIMGKEDWDSVDARTTPHAKRDIVATDGMKVTVGDTTVTVYLTPGHTPGTISTVIPIKDKGKSYTALLWGGTLLNRQGPALQNYIASTAKMRDVVAKQKIDILMSNHTAFDGSKIKLPAVLARKGNDPNPYVVGTPSVTRFLTMAGECAQAASLQAQVAPPAPAPAPAAR
jgi:metallo-beta-lactamase class B